MGLALETIPYYDNGGGLNLKSSPTKIKEDEASLCLNIDYSIDGALLTRNGSRIANIDANGLPAQIAGAPDILYMFDYHKSDGTQINIICAGLHIYHNLQSPTIQPPTITTQNIPCIEFFVTLDDEYAVYGNGIDHNLKFNGTVYNDLSLQRPAAPGLADGGAGTLPAGDYTYYYSYIREVGGVVVQEGELSPAATITLAVNKSVDITLLASTELPAQVTGMNIYRASTAAGFTGIAKFLKREPNTNHVYHDDDATEGSIFAEFDNQAAPTSAVFCEYNGKMVYRDDANPTDYLVSKLNKPWNVPEESRTILDGKITCIHRTYGVIIIGTNAPSLWVINGDPDTTDPRRVSSDIGILNNRCAVGESLLYILATNRRFYSISPTDFSQNEIRTDVPDSIVIEPLFNLIGANSTEQVCMEYYNAPNIAKVFISAPIGLPTNNAVIVYNETQSRLKGKPCWQPWDNINANALRKFIIQGNINIYSGDYNGFLWKLDDPSLFGDGAALNGTSTGGNTMTTLNHILVQSTATSGAASSLTDTTQNFIINSLSTKTIEIIAGLGVGQTRVVLSNTATVINVTIPWAIVPDNTSVYRIGNFIPGAYVGMIIRIIGGTGNIEQGVIVSNTSITVTVASAWSIAIPDATSQYTIGGYNVYHYTNWKYVVESFDVLKQLWFIWINANANGNYNIEMLIQVDFDQSEVNADTILVNLRSENTIWGEFIWGEAVWGARAVFQDRFRTFSRFRAVRVGFRNRKAGQPFQINGFSLSVQNKRLFFRST